MFSSYVKNNKYEHIGLPDFKTKIGEILSDPVKKASIISKHFNSYDGKEGLISNVKQMGELYR